MTTKRIIGPFALKDAAKGEVEAVFSTFNVVDKDGDWTPPGAFEDGAPVLISGYGHSSWAGQLPVGKGTIKTTAKDARLVGKFFLDTQGGRDTFAVVRELGPRQQWSYGFDVKETGELTDELRQRGVRRVLKSLLVHEVSPVLLGAGVDTRTISAKCSGCGAAPGSSCGCHAKHVALTAADRAVLDRTFDEAKGLLRDVAARRPPGVDEVLVTGWLAEFAKEAADAAARHFGIGPVDVRWFSGKSRPNSAGFVTPLDDNAIWLREGLRGADLLKIVGHEVAHLAQRARGDVYDELESKRFGERLAKSDPLHWGSEIGPRVYDR